MAPVCNNSSTTLIYTDHKPLTHAFTLKKEKLPPVQPNQLSFLLQFTTDIDYIEGSKNVVVVALSCVEAVSFINYEDLSRSQTNDESLESFLKNSQSSL